MPAIFRAGQPHMFSASPIRAGTATPAQGYPLGRPFDSRPPAIATCSRATGHDQHDSYGYLGGTGTKIINPNPQ